MDAVTFEVQPGITAIDTFFAGRQRCTAAYLLDASEPTVVETGPAKSVEPVVAGLGRLGKVDRVCDLAKRRIQSWSDVVRDVIDRTDDPDEIASLLEREAARDVQTGAQAEIDLERL
ncbi:MAG: hypothetical protein AB1551_09095, partial [Actinomycetota bacterium]